jgi:hypothetical protein
VGKTLGVDAMSEYFMGLVEGPDLERFWPGVDGMMQKIPHTLGHWTREEIRAGVYAGHFQLWGCGPRPDATFMLLTNIAYYPSKNILMIGWGAGSFKKEMLPVLDATLNNFADMMNCSEIEIHGRQGWVKALASIGFKQSKVVLSRQVYKGGLQ